MEWSDHCAIKCSLERVAELEELVAHHQTERDEMLIQLEVANQSFATRSELLQLKHR